ncbi:hypothetical protein UT300012_31300 [Paraclostridium bifermentans]
MKSINKECYLNYPFGDCDNCEDITTRIECIQNSTGYCGCKRKLSENDRERTCELCGAIVCSECAIYDEDDNGDVYCKSCSDKYVETDKYDLIHGDCLEELRLLSDKSIDLVIIDPPYEIKTMKGGWTIGKRKYKDEVSTMINGFSEEVLDLLCQKMKKINIYIYCSKLQLPKLLNYFIDRKCNYEILTYHKTNPTPLCGNTYLPDTEYIVFAREKGVKIRGEYKTKFKYYTDKVNKGDKKKYNHPTCKPVPLLINHILNSSDENDVVLDCFMGSGSTGEACVNTNRRFVGIELNKEYFKTAKQRLENIG